MADCTPTNAPNSTTTATTRGREDLNLEAARAKLYQIIDQAERDIAEGKVAEAHKAIAETKRLYTL